jgi:hypothetical protein
VDLLHQSAGRRRAEDGLEQPCDLRAPEALELDALHGPDALPAGDQRPQRMAAVQLVGAEADDHQHAIGAHGAHEQGHEIERRPIRPMQVLDHEHERAVGREPLDHADDQLEQACRATLTERGGAERAVGVEAGQDLCQLGAGGPDDGVELLRRRIAHERAQRVRERAERQPLAAHLDAAAGEDPHPRGVRALSGLLDQSRLAHAGLATEEDHRRIARDSSVQRGGQRRQLGFSADEDRADESASHRAHVLSLRRGRLGEHRKTRRCARRGTTAMLDPLGLTHADIGI